MYTNNMSMDSVFIAMDMCLIRECARVNTSVVDTTFIRLYILIYINISLYIDVLGKCIQTTEKERQNGAKIKPIDNETTWERIK